MKVQFNKEELAYVGNFLSNIIATLKPPRKQRRQIQRLAQKFQPSAVYVWLKPGERQQLGEILANGLQALEASSDSLRDRKFFSKIGSFLKGNPEEQHLVKVGGVFDSVIEKLAL